MTWDERPGAAQHLLRLMDEVGRASSIEELCQSALTCLGHLVGVERASVLVFDDTGTMRFVAWRGLSDAYRRAVDGHSPWRPDEKNAAPIAVPDVHADGSLSALLPVLEREGIAALAFIPLCFADKLLGKFMLYSNEVRVFDDREISLARVVAGHIAFALEHGRAERDLKTQLRMEHAARSQAEAEITRRRELEEHRELLLRAGQTLSRSLDVDDTLQALSELIVPRYADWYAVHLVRGAGEVVPARIAHIDPARVRLAWDAVSRWRDGAASQLGAAAAVRTGRSRLFSQVSPALLRDAAQDAEHLKLLLELGLHSAIVVPLTLSGRIIGAMTFVTAESGRSYGPDDLAIFEALANRAALAIDNARLYREAGAAREAAESAAQRLALLARATESIAPSLDPDAALSQLARFAVTSLADYCITYRLESDGTVRRVGLAHGDPAQQPLVEALVSAGPPGLDDPYGAGAVLRTGEPVLVSEVLPEMLEACAQNTRHTDVLRQLRPVSSIVLPLKARERMLGAVAFVSTIRSGRRYDEADLALTQELASRAALLVDNARLYSGALAAMRARDEMLAIVSHDLRSPLNSVVTACDLLELDIAPERRARTHASIRRATRQMSRLLEALLDVTQIEEGRLSLYKAPVDVSLLLAEILSVHAPVAEDRGVRLTQEVAPDVLEVEGDRNRLAQAISNLLDNALKFTPEGGEVRVSCSRSGGSVHISVSDTGPGIPPEQLPNLFDRFWRADRKSRAGVGLGLAIARGIAQAHGGDIEVASELGAGTRFTVVFDAASPPRESHPWPLSGTKVARLG